MGVTFVCTAEVVESVLPLWCQSRKFATPDGITVSANRSNPITTGGSDAQHDDIVVLLWTQETRLLASITHRHQTTRTDPVVVMRIWWRGVAK